MLRGDRLGEAAVERRREDDLGAVADAALAQVPVRQECELDRCDRALDRHVDDIHDERAALERGQCLGKRVRTFGGVEGEDVLHPARTGETLGLLRGEPCAGRDDQDVVGENRAVGEMDAVVVERHVVDVALVERDSRVQLAVPRPHDLLCSVQARRGRTGGRAGRRAGRPCRRRRSRPLLVVASCGDGSPSACRRCRRPESRSFSPSSHLPCLLRSVALPVSWSGPGNAHRGVAHVRSVTTTYAIQSYSCVDLKSNRRQRRSRCRVEMTR